MVRADEITVGVEEEYALVDAATGELKGRASYLLADHWSDDLKPEMQEHTVEVGTRVCMGTRCLREDLAQLRMQAAVAAEAEGVRIMAAGAHPYAVPDRFEFTDSPVYEQIHAEYRALATSQAIFGMHVHVGVPAHVDRVRVSNVARLYLPYLLALTASSPLWEGRDTGYSSFRALVWRRWPRSGPPPRLEGDRELEELRRWLYDTGSIDAPGRIYWDLRPHHKYPTLEFRVTDVTPRLQDAIATAGLTRAIVAAIVEGALEEPPTLAPAVLQALLAENSWRASRDGTDATFVDLWSPTPRTVPARDALSRLAERVAPFATALGDGGIMDDVGALLERPGAAAEIRTRAAEGDPAEVVRWIADETVLGLGLDRRSYQRGEEVS